MRGWRARPISARLSYRFVRIISSSRHATVVYGGYLALVRRAGRVGHARRSDPPQVSRESRHERCRHHQDVRGRLGRAQFSAPRSSGIRPRGRARDLASRVHGRRAGLRVRRGGHGNVLPEGLHRHGAGRLALPLRGDPDRDRQHGARAGRLQLEGARPLGRRAEARGRRRLGPGERRFGRHVRQGLRREHRRHGAL